MEKHTAPAFVKKIERGWPRENPRSVVSVCGYEFVGQLHHLCMLSGVFEKFLCYTSPFPWLLPVSLSTVSVTQLVCG